ncbi:MAG: HAMP domain-containing sensor histidine kinase [Vicinamibacterales bacterium]
MSPRWSTSGGDGDSRRSSAILVLAAGLSLATATLVGLAWTATNEMRRSTSLLIDRRASEVLALSSAAIGRDMKGAWLSALVPSDLASIDGDPYDLLDLTSRTFARFPYPESFIVWTDDGSPDGRTFAFNRSDRALPWVSEGTQREPYPVTLLREPPALRTLVGRVRDEARRRRQFSAIDVELGGARYQVVARYFFAPSDRLAGVIAFTVNLDFVRTDYLGELLRQVATIDGDQAAMAISVVDERQALVASSGASPAATPARRRTFPLLFLEPALVSPSPDEAAPPLWTVQVQPAASATGVGTALGRRLLLITSLAGAAALGALVLTVRAVRASAELASMKSEFVAAVTHELKTPLALIKLVGDTLERGRYTSADTIREYASILSQQERRLGHLIENLLAYSRASEDKPMYARDAVDVSEAVDDALEPFRPRMTDLGFELSVTIDPDLPQVRGDAVALVQVFANLIDNAIKYSPGRRTLAIEARADGEWVQVEFADGGMGIPADEISSVFERFYRGRDAREFGSGLGLAIVRRITDLHGGRVGLTSAPGAGTTVRVMLPLLRRT